MTSSRQPDSFKPLEQSNYDYATLKQEQRKSIMHMRKSFSHPSAESRKKKKKSNHRVEAHAAIHERPQEEEEETGRINLRVRTKTQQARTTKPSFTNRGGIFRKRLDLLWDGKTTRRYHIPRMYTQQSSRYTSRRPSRRSRINYSRGAGQYSRDIMRVDYLSEEVWRRRQYETRYA